VLSGSTWQGLALAAREPVTWALVFFYFVSFGDFLALTAWLPTYWHAVYAVSLTAGGLLTLIFSLVTALVRVPGGLLSDRLSIRYALAGNFGLILVASLAASFSGSFVLSLAAMIGIALGMRLQNAIVFKLLPRFVPHAVGGASGWVAWGAGRLRVASGYGLDRGRGDGNRRLRTGVPRVLRPGRPGPGHDRLAGPLARSIARACRSRLRVTQT
jgi:NNP family nitrate/nitrite transporter-like MFS transporter